MTGRLPAVCAVFGTPGSGRSSVAANLAVLAAKRRQRVLLIDLDLENPSQRLDFGLPAETAGVSAAIRLFAQGRLEPERLFKIAPTITGTRERLRILTGVMHPDELVRVNAQAIQGLLEFAANNFDRVFVDTTALSLLGSVSETPDHIEAITRMSTSAMLVADPSPVGAQRLIAAAKRLQAMHPPPMAVVINRARPGLHSPSEVGVATQRLAGFGIDFEVPYERLLFDRASLEGRQALMIARRGALREVYARILESVAPP